MGSALTQFDRGAARAARQIIAHYSSSFSLSTALLPGPLRADIHNLYAMVRIADEIVDGAAAAAGADAARILADYERAVLAAPHQHFHPDPILHAYADTARRCAFNPAHLQAFFASMRRDLTPQSYTNPRNFAEYVYGSAEVIGLLCLAVFLHHQPVPPSAHAALEHGARRLGAAFQTINFLRDIHEDQQLRRHYLTILNDADKAALIAEIRADLATARTTVPLLPRCARVGVTAAINLFDELTDRMDRVPVSQLGNTRVRVSTPRKLLITARALRSLP